MMKCKIRWRKPIHRFIVWYTIKCGGAFHSFPYGDKGKYVVVMSEAMYHEWRLSKTNWY